ncbi:MAG: glutathione S-transferase family protein [Octadecabacter sp.]|nr:glutathione S-transferase family protein [Octadecabacter sp.]
MTRLILHYAPDNASLCVRLALEAAHIPYETRLVDRRQSGQRSLDYLALNPNGLIPVLETPDGALFETAAILLWQAEQHPALLPATPPVRAKAVTWLFWMSNTLHPTLRMLFYPDQFTAAAHSAALNSRTLTRLNQQLAILDAAASGAAWIGADTPNVLDCYLCPMLRWIALYPVDADARPKLADYPALLRIARRMEAHPASQAAIEAEGLGPTPITAPRLPCPPEGHAT